MKASPEFMTFGLQFIQDIEDLGDTLDEFLRSVLRPFNRDPEARKRLRAFIDEALRDDVSDEELMALWDSTPADIFFHRASELRRMLRDARDRL